jgi:hypothetical protein
MEGKRKRGRPNKRRSDEVREDLNTMEIKKQARNGQTPSGVEEDCVESKCSQRIAAREEEEEKLMKNAEQLNDSIHPNIRQTPPPFTIFSFHESTYTKPIYFVCIIRLRPIFQMMY